MDKHTDTDDNVIPHDLSVRRAYGGFASIDLFRFRIGRFDGSQQHLDREIYQRGEAACVLPYDARTDSVLLIRQFLAGALAAGRTNRPLQVIAGMIDDGETPRQSARREAAEEAGLTVIDLEQGPVFMPSPGGSSEVIHCYVALVDLTDAGGYFGLSTEGEDIRAEVMSVDAAIAELDAGRIEAAPAVVLLNWFARHHRGLRERGHAIFEAIE